jgi:hypothetical protein
MARGGELIQLLNGRAGLLETKSKLAMGPTKNDFEAKLYGDMAGDVTPQGKGGNLLKGILEGVSDVKGKAAVDERNAQMKKSMEAIQKLEKFYEDTSTKLQKAQNEELAMEAMLPALNGAVQAMPRLDPVGRKELITNILDQWNVRTGNSISLVSQDATDPMLVTLKDNQTGQTMTNSLTALFPGSPGLADNMSQMQPAMVEKRQMERDYLNIAKQAEGRHQQEFQLEKQEAANELPPAEKKRQETLASKGAEMDLKYADETLTKAHKANELMSVVQSLKGMIKNGKVELGPEAIKSFKRQFPMFNNVEGNTKAQQYTAMVKGLINAYSDLGFPVRNQKEFEEGILSQLPTIDKTPAAANAILDKLQTRLEGAIHEGQGIKQAIQENNGIIPADIRYRNSLEAPQPQAEPSPPQQQGGELKEGEVKVIAPDGGEYAIPIDQLQNALQQGAKIYGQ